ncbi:MAG: lysostaphin resistance A-like protein [Candidatus Hodarchaeota archaeon]
MERPTEILDRSAKLTNKDRSTLSRHPWISIVLLVALLVFSLITTRLLIGGLMQLGVIFSPITESLVGISVGILVYFGLVPYGLGLPQRRTSIREYMHTIGIRRPKSLTKAMILIVPCTAFLFLSWLLASLSYNYFVLGQNWAIFLDQLWTTSRAVPPQNWAMVTSLGVYLEEVIFRGILIKMLSERYSEHATITLSAVAFGVVHLLNILNGPLSIELVIGVLAQIIFVSIYGLFYGYLFVKTGNLLPNIILHYIGNAFISFFWYTPGASWPVYTILMLVFYIGPVPTILSIMWVKYASNRWCANEL